MGVGAGHAGIGAHPVVGVAGALLGGQDGQQRRQGVDGPALPRRKMQLLAVQLEVVSGFGLAPARTIAFPLHPQVEQFK